MIRTTSIQNPLSAWLYFRRNPARNLPVVVALALAVVLVAGIVTIVSSVDQTVLTMYGYQRYLSIVTPRNALRLSDELRSEVIKLVPNARTFDVIPAWTNVRTVFGKMPFPIMGVAHQDREFLAEACGVSLVTGRWPAKGAPEIAMSEAIAKNRDLKLGDIVLDPKSEDNFAAEPMKLVGTLRGPVWLAVASAEFVRDRFPVAIHGLAVIGASEQSQRSIDVLLDKQLDKSTARAWTYRTLVRDTRDALSSLYLMMRVIVVIIAVTVALLAGMLAGIHFGQRLGEFATLVAIGYSQRFLLRRIVGEIAILCVVAWTLGLLVTVAMLFGLAKWVMEPRGLLLDPMYPAAYLYTLPVPFALGVFSLVTVTRRLHKMDAVSVIERR